MIKRLLHRLLVEDRSGATAIEMGFLVALISVAIIGSLHTFSNQLNNTLNITTTNIALTP
ncbi:Flp family type IVb pilin [Novosphingobium sp.]|uniref:Flp family type IVb pilin n=1 Tax=Novosphingobium sp. TaxID=1874826 RepID=UPI00262A8CD0|nr:Flp family type IVb pilin [Novosphingobium sp.]